MAEPAQKTEAKESILSINNIEVVYDEVILVLRGISLEVPKGEIVTLLGPNGAGKSTTLKAISGLLQTEDGEVTRGSIHFKGESIANRAPDEIVRKGDISDHGGPAYHRGYDGCRKFAFRCLHPS